jgi:hypothetical protein
MANDYIITLKRPGYKAIDLVSIFLIIIFLVAFSYYILQTGLQGRNGLLLLIPAMIIVQMIRGFTQRKHPDFLVYYRTELFIAALGWMLLPVYKEIRYIGWLYAIMAFIERYVKSPDQWSFSKENVMHLIFPKQTYEWVEIDNVVIRDNLFTLDLRNNKIIQKELDVPVDKALEEEFNAYCKEQLHFRNLEV